jgi:hypothetical protein
VILSQFSSLRTVFISAVIKFMSTFDIRMNVHHNNYVILTHSPGHHDIKHELCKIVYLVSR